MLPDDNVRNVCLQYDVFSHETGSLRQTHPRIRHQRDQPTQVIVNFEALPLHGTEEVTWQWRPLLHSRLAVVVNPGKGIEQRDPHLTGGEVQHRSDGAKDASDAAPGETTTDKHIPEVRRVRSCVVQQVLVTTSIDDVATKIARQLDEKLQGDYGL